MTKAVVLHSGGLDSTTLLEKALEDGNDVILALSIKYGSLHNDAEGNAAAEIIDFYRSLDELSTFTREVYELPAAIFTGQNSALMGETPMPSLTYAEIHDSVGPSPTVVPFRNANLIAIATAIAEARGFDYVYIGAHGEDAHNWAYPDCTPEFLGAMANAVHVGTYHKVALRFPFIWMQKYNIVEYAAAMGVPLGLTWSCYNPRWFDAMIGEDDVVEGHFTHCGTCPTCIERAQAFAQAGYVDPTNYVIPLEDIIGDDFDIDSLEEYPA